MTTAAGAAVVTAALVLATIAGLQVLGAAGRPVGRFLWGGQHEVLPQRLRIGSALSVAVYAVIMVALVARTGAFGAVGTSVSVTAWVLVGYFAVGVVLNAVSRSRAERLTMTPACVVLTACCLVVATG